MGMENGESQKYTEVIGSRFGRLVVSDVGREKGRVVYYCTCDCGKQKVVRREHLLRGRTLSCGCYHAEVTSRISKTHGMKNTRLYRCWRNMKTRCYNPSYIEYIRYGGRGISVCEEWQAFEPFYEWAMKSGYENGLSIDRIDNNGNYCPDNCKWSTNREQSLNRSSNAFLTYNGVTKHVSEWDKDIGATKSGRVRARLNAGWSIEEAVTIPVTHSGYRRP